jgi:hypothetical protein
MPEREPRGFRATNIQELEAVLDKIFSSANLQRSLAFQPRPGDIIISPYPKCGTTWLQQIAHGLRTGGSMDFDEITAVTPWIEVAFDIGWDLDAPQVAEPRVFKSHLSYYEMPKGARYICAFRNYHDAMVSYYRFFEGWMFEPGTISLDALTDWRWPADQIESRGYWYHLRSWWEQRHNPDVLLLCYEDMQADLTETVRKVAHFMGIALEDRLLHTVVRQSSRQFMLAHRQKFDSRHMREIGSNRAGLPLFPNADKVTAGPQKRSGGLIGPAVKTRLDGFWKDQITARFGLADYGDLRRALRELHRQAREAETGGPGEGEALGPPGW